MYPWNESLFEQLKTSRERLPHGLLFAGPNGLGKMDVALEFARVELCANKTACRACQPCQLFEAGSLPDLHLFAAEVYADNLSGLAEKFSLRHMPERKKDRKLRPTLTIDQIRNAIEVLAKRPHIASSTVAIIAPAEAMNVNSANALLKLLEEPPADTRIILLTAAPGRLLPTILSRASSVDFRPPADSEAAAWLAGKGVRHGVHELLRLADGAPPRALKLHESGFMKVHGELVGEVAGLATGRRSAVDAAKTWAKLGPKAVLEGLVRVIDDWLRALHTANLPAGGQMSQLQGCEQGLSLKDIHAVRAHLARSASTWDSALDASLVLEDAFLAIGALSGGKAR